MTFINIPGATSWKAPVSTFSALPSSGNNNGDVRVTLDTDLIYIWGSGAWNSASGSVAWGSITGTLSNQTDLQSALNAKVDTSSVGAANGVASLDSGGKVPATQLPSTLMDYRGAWDASTNTPTLADGTGTNGDVYRVSVAGTQNLGSGSQTFFVGDFIIYNGTIWQRSPAADGVISVNGQSGAVTVNAINQLTGDITAGPASGSASAAATLATVNASPGSYGDASHSLSATVNAKGLITSLSTNSIQIAESQVTNLVSDLAAKQSTTLTSAHLLVGNGLNVATDVAASGDLSLDNTGAFTFKTVNLNTGSFGSSTAIPSFTVNGKGLITAASTNAVVAPAGTLTGTTLASNIVSSSLTSVGTLTGLTVNGSFILDGSTSGTLTQQAAATTTSYSLTWPSAQGGSNSFLTNNGSGTLSFSSGSTATSFLSNFVGDSGSGGTKGLVPAPAAGDAAAGKFLKADGTWTAPASGITGSGTSGQVTVFNGTSSVTSYSGFTSDSSGNIVTNSTKSGSGTVSANGIQVGAAGTGLYSSAANTLDIAANGVNLMDFSSTGVITHTNNASLTNSSFVIIDNKTNSAAGLLVKGAYTTYTHLDIQNTSTGGNTWGFYSAGVDFTHSGIGALTTFSSSTNHHTMIIDKYDSVGIGGLAQNVPTNNGLVAFTVAPQADKSNIGGTTTVNSSTSLVLSGGEIGQLGIGDRVSVSSAASTYATVKAVNLSTQTATLDAALGNGSSQTVNKKKAIQRWDTAGLTSVGLISDLGRFLIGNVANLGTPIARLQVDNGSSGDDIVVAQVNGTTYHKIDSTGKKGQLSSGGAAICGTATLTAGTVTVSTTNVTANSIIFLTRNTPGGTLGNLSAPSASIIAGTSFVINSDNASDTSTVNWHIIEKL